MRRAISFLLLGLISACGARHDRLPNLQSGETVTVVDAERHEAALALLKAECAGCHGAASPAYGAFDTVTDVDAMFAGGRLVPGNAATSLLYLRATDGSMPPGIGLGRAQRQLLREWIDAALQ